MTILNIKNEKEEVFNYLANTGFLQREVKSEKKYFVNNKGLQIRIGSDGVTFLGKTGYVIEKHKQLVLEVVEELVKLN